MQALHTASTQRHEQGPGYHRSAAAGTAPLQRARQQHCCARAPCLQPAWQRAARQALGAQLRLNMPLMIPLVASFWTCCGAGAECDRKWVRRVRVSVDLGTGKHSLHKLQAVRVLQHRPAAKEKQARGA